MTISPDALAAILDTIRNGGTLGQALRGAGVPVRAWAAACAADPTLEQALADAKPPTPGGADSHDAIRGVPAREAIPAVSPSTEASKPSTVRAEWNALAAKLASAQSEAPAATSAPSKRAAEHSDDGAPDWQRIRDEAAELAHGPFGMFLWLERKLVAAGYPPVSPWWLATLRAFYESGKRWLVVMAGRGAGKSTMLTRVAVAEGLFTPRSSPPGEAWIWPFVSASTKDARNRIRQIAAILSTLGIRDEKGKPVEPSYPHGHPTIATFDASGNPIEFVAYAGTIAALSGPTSIGATVDEEAKLRGDGSANPSGEVILTLAATFRARPGIRAIRCSSAWLTEGSHYGAVMDGDTIMNAVARIGADFLPDVLDGLDAVARWEVLRGDAEAAARIREHAASLTPDSVNATTWLGNPTLGNPEGPYPWLGAAVASRIEMETLDQKTFDSLFPGMTRATAWLRECASVPVLADGVDPMTQIHGLAEANEMLAALVRGEVRTRIDTNADVEPMKLRGAPPGDARYAGPTARAILRPPGWDRGDVF